MSARAARPDDGTSTVAVARRKPAPETARTLKAALAELQIIFDNAIAGVVYTRERVIVRCNRRFEEMFGYGPGELNGQDAVILYPSREAYERIGRVGYGYLETHDSYSDERVMRRRNGERFWSQVSGRVLDHEHPSSAGIWIFQDITEQKQAQEAMARANERLEQRVQERAADLKRAYEALREQQAELARVSRLNTMGEMAAALAHELGQPLAATLNYLHGCQLRLQAGEFDRELFESAVSQAIHHAEHAGQIVKHVRQFVRRHDPESVLVSINALIEEMVSFLDFERRQSDATITLDLAKGDPHAMIDPLEIKQVLVNLIKNAFEAMVETAPEQRLVTIATAVRRRTIQVSVADRGPGVARKRLTQIFNPFYTTKTNGMGLGLAVCRSIVESHEGRLTVERNVHGGATFCFTLPAKERPVLPP